MRVFVKYSVIGQIIYGMGSIYNLFALIPCFVNVRASKLLAIRERLNALLMNKQFSKQYLLFTTG